MPELTSRPRLEEEGVAMLVAILVLVVIGLVMTVALTVSANTTREVTDIGRRSAAQLVAEGAASSIAESLQSQGEVLGDALDINANVIRGAATLAGGSVVSGDGGGYAFPSATPAPLRFTVVGVEGEGYRTNWQVLSIIQPDITAAPPRSYVTVYIRAWTGTGAASSKASVIKTRFRPGTFFDYQVISDVSIQFEAGTAITGNVHTNGFIDDTLLPSGSVYDRIWTTGAPASCTTPPGGTRPVISTARGTIASVSAASCTLRPNTDESISLARVESSFRAIQANCGAAGVRCFVAPGAAPGTGRWRVNLGTGAVTSTFGASGTLPTPNASGGRAAIFDRDVEVSGTAAGRTTIATRSTSPMMGATDIRIIGNVAAAASSATVHNALALLAENDVVIDTGVSCVTNVRAALVASTGSVTIPREDRASILMGSIPPLCPTINFTGSMASHGSIIMKWRIGTNPVGYAARTYSWDPWLAYYPPPFVPLAHPWELGGVEVASGDCFRDGVVPGGAACG